MSKIDIAQRSDSELSLIVFNDEGLYRMRKNSQFIGLLMDIFIFTDEQLEELEQDLFNEDLV
jgi:hypothetical protein